MAKQRYISTSFWDDAWIQELDPSEKLLYLYLMTNPLTNIAGVYKITVRRIVFDTGFNKDTVTRILGRFKKDKKAVLHGEYMIIPSWPKHQQWDKRTKIRDGIEAVLKEIPEEVKKHMVSIRYAYPIEGYEYLRNYSDINTDTDINTDINKAPSAAASQLVSASDDEKELYNKIKTVFEREQPGQRFTNYGKEGKAIKGLIVKARARSPDDPQTFIAGMIRQFASMRQSGDKFWRGQPFLPSALNASGIFDRVLSAAQEEHEDIMQAQENFEEVLF